MAAEKSFRIPTHVALSDEVQQMRRDGKSPEEIHKFATAKHPVDMKKLAETHPVKAVVAPPAPPAKEPPKDEKGHGHK